jgi:hypothetical protein
VPPKPKPAKTKYWYKISLDTVRLWVIFFILAFGLIGGSYGYKLLNRHLLHRQFDVTMTEAQDLLAQLGTTAGASNFRSRLRNARESLQEARRRLAEGELQAALVNAQRGRSTLVAIMDSLQRKGGVSEAHFVNVQGGVEFRRGERGEWQTARSRVRLFAGDYVKTSAGGSAELMMLEGTIFNVRPDTVVLVSRSRSKGGGPSEQTLALESGWINLSTSQTSSLVTTPDAEARVAERSQAVVAYDTERQVGRFAAYRGAMEVTTARGETRKLGELQEIVQAQSTLSGARSLPPSPLLLEPRDNLEVDLSKRKEIELTWEPVRGARSYALQVSRNRLFVDNIIDVSRRTKTSARLGLQGDGTFLWRVAAFDEDGDQSPWSLPKRFRVTAPVEPSAVSDGANEGEPVAWISDHAFATTSGFETGAPVPGAG